MARHKQITGRTVEVNQVASYYLKKLPKDDSPYAGWYNVVIRMDGHEYQDDEIFKFKVDAAKKGAELVKKARG